MSRLTTKYQATVPKPIREVLKLKAGAELDWHVVRGMVVVDTVKKVKDPVKFLTSQVKFDLDAVKLVKETREEFG